MPHAHHRARRLGETQAFSSLLFLHKRNHQRTCVQNCRSNTSEAKPWTWNFLACFPMCVGEVRYQAPQYHSLARFLDCFVVFIFLLLCHSRWCSIRGGILEATVYNIELEREGKKKLIQRIARRLLLVPSFSLKFIPHLRIFNFSQRTSGSDVGVCINWTKLERILNEDFLLCH